MGGDKGDKKNTDGAPPTAPSAATPAKATHTVSDALRDKVKRMYPKKQSNVDRVIKALEAGKVVHVGSHKLRADKV